MPALDIPFFGTLVLSLILISASYTMAMAMGAGRGRPHLLPSARWGTYATCALVVVAVCVLAYAFQVHDFRIRYVARYSDRSMPWWYLIASLWGGQDGSLLWWAFLLCGVHLLRDALAPRPIHGASAVDSRHADEHSDLLRSADALRGQSVRDVHPDDAQATVKVSTRCFRTTGWPSIRRASTWASSVGRYRLRSLSLRLITGRLGNEWVRAARLWSMIAWTFLSLGLLLGCLWSYEELGWGGYWAWDPVENASFMPWLVGTAYLHSVLIQERRHMMKVWNVFLLALTFFLTIFGTFLTRSGPHRERPLVRSLRHRPVLRLVHGRF